MGWVLKSSAKRKRLSGIQKKFLIDLLDAGEQTGQKSDPADVSRAMRSARHNDSSRLFGMNDFLTPQQITSFFSRLAKKRRENAAGDKDKEHRDDRGEDNYEEDKVNKNDFQQRKEEEIEALSVTLMDTFGLKHPITFDKHNICELNSQRKVSKFSVSLLQEICTSLELDVSSITGKQKFKKPYIDLLEELVHSQGPRKIDNWGEGHIFIYLCCASLISFEIDCFYSL